MRYIPIPEPNPSHEFYIINIRIKGTRKNHLAMSGKLDGGEKGGVYVYGKISDDKYKFIGMGDSSFVSMKLESG